MGEEEETTAATARAAEQARELQDAAAALLTRTRAEEEALRRRAAALKEELRRLRKAASAHADSEKVRCSPTPAYHSLSVPRVRACVLPSRCEWAELPDQSLPPDCRARLGFHALLFRPCVSVGGDRAGAAGPDRRGDLPARDLDLACDVHKPRLSKCQFASLERQLF
jgi:hypothetical protein